MRKSLIVLAALTLSVGMWAETKPAGAGTELNPYLLATVEDLQWFSAQVNQGGGNVFLCAKLINDIGYLDESNRYFHLTPIGSAVTGGGYKGNFDGNGHSIVRMLQDEDDGADNMGLFGKINCGHVHHLGMVDCKVYASGNYSGMICADLACGGIDHCFVRGGTLLRNNYGGGLVGSCYTNGYLHDCYVGGAFQVRVYYGHNSARTGSIAGEVYGTITNCYAENVATCDEDVFTHKVGNPTIENVEMVTKEDFASGKICYYLNNISTYPFYQTLGTDTYPVLDASHGRVYASFIGGDLVFSNTEPTHGNVFHPQSKPTCETRGFTQDCYENLDNGKIYEDLECTKELDPAVVVRYAKFAASPVLNLDSFSIKEDTTYNGVPFHWAVEKKFEPIYEYEEMYSMEFIVNDDTPTNARIKWYKSLTSNKSYEHFYFYVYVNGNTVSYIEKETKEAMFVVPLGGLKNGDSIKINVKRRSLFNEGSTTIAATLEYCSPNCGAYSDITITPTAPSFRKAQGTADPTFSYKVEGHILDEFPLRNITVTREQGETPGKYILTASCPKGANPNYNITFKTETFTIVNTIYHPRAVAPDCQSFGWKGTCWEEVETHLLYKDSMLTQNISWEDAIAYPELVTNCFTATSSGWREHPVETDVGRGGDIRTGTFHIYGRNIKNARLVIESRIYYSMPSHILDAIEGTYEYDEKKGTWYLDPAIRCRYVDLPDLKYGDELKITCKTQMLIELGGVPFLFTLEYLSDNCGEADPEDTALPTLPYDEKVRKGSFKVIENGHFRIIRNDKRYTIMGVEE